MRNVDVLDGLGGVVTHSDNGNLEYGEITLRDCVPPGQVKTGANYSVRENGGQPYRCTCTDGGQANTTFKIH